MLRSNPAVAAYDAAIREEALRRAEALAVARAQAHRLELERQAALETQRRLEAQRQAAERAEFARRIQEMEEAQSRVQAMKDLVLGEGNMARVRQADLYKLLDPRLNWADCNANYRSIPLTASEYEAKMKLLWKALENVDDNDKWRVLRDGMQKMNESSRNRVSR